MKKILLIIISTITFAFTTQAQNVNIPDSKFKAYLIGRKDSINTNKDTEISVTEAEAFTGTINVSNKGITSLTGIESFVNLTYLECNDNQLTTLDISKNTALKSLICYWNVLTTLIIQNNSALVYLDCHFNKLKNLDLSTSPALTDIWCSYNDLTTLNLNNNSSLKYLWCQNMKLTNLDLSNNLVMSNGAIRIASQLKSYLGQSLILLDLKKNKIGNTGCEGFCKSLWHNMKLIYLDLSYCELDDRSLVHISQML